MQNYGQPPGYQRPATTASFVGQPPPPLPPPPPSYGAPQGYQSVAPQAQSQWAAPAPTQAANPWNQQQQQPQQQQPAGGYNQGTYGAVPGGYGQPQQRHDIPPPPPPKPYGFAGALQNQQQQQNAQNWGQQPQQQQPQPQQNTPFTPPQQGGYPVQGAPQPYNQAVPPPPSATPGGSYFPPSQGGQPGSTYGASPVGPSQVSSVVSPNEQHPANIPPSLTGQGVQAYIPSNTNPAPGVYVPPPPDIPAWQQAQHAPLQGGNKKFRYTKPTVDPSFYAQGYQDVQSQQPQQPQQPYGQPPQNQFTPQGQPLQPPPPLQNQFQQQQPQQPQPQFAPTGAPQQHSQPFGQGAQPQTQSQQPPPPPQYNQTPHGQQINQPPQYPQQQGQWQQPPPTVQGFGQQQNAQPSYGHQQQPQWQPGHDTQGSLASQQPSQTPDQGIQAPKPISRTDTASSNFFNQSSPQSQPVSPVNNRQSMSFPSTNQTSLARHGSVSSIALANLHAQRGDNRTSSPKPASLKLPTPPPPRDDKSKFSALGTGGPSDWEHFSVDDEVDDEHIFTKKDENKSEPAQLDSVELPAHVPSPPSTHGWPSPAVHTAPLNLGAKRDSYAPTPPPATASPARRPPSQPPPQSFVMGDANVAPFKTSPQPTQTFQSPPAQQSFVVGDAYIPPKNSTPAQQEHPHQPPSSQQGFVMNDGGWAAQSAPSQAREQPAQQHQEPPSAAKGFVMNDGGWGAQTSTQASTSWGSQPGGNHTAELKAKDGELERLRVEFEKVKAELQSEIDKMRAEGEEAKTHSAGEARVLHEQIEHLKTTAAQAKTDSDAMIKEKDMTIERLNEDVEGRQHNIGERDALVIDLRNQLEAEKMKEPAKPSPADLIPDINPWYVGSLERYIAMLRAEEGEPEVNDKMNVFKAFLRAESAVRGIEYYDSPPPAPVANTTHSHQPEQPNFHQNPSNNSVQKQGLNVRVPLEPPVDDDDYEISPGGRPVFNRTGTFPSTERDPAKQPISPPDQPITTPAHTGPAENVSNNDIQPSEEQSQPQPQYKAYVPPAGNPTNEFAAPIHRQSMIAANLPTVTNPAAPNVGRDEIFFGTEGPETPKARERSPSRDNKPTDVSVPLPLGLSANRPASAAPPSRVVPVHSWADLLPSSIAPAGPNQLVEELRTRVAGVQTAPTNTEELTKVWEKSASLIRRKNDSARRTRQEESEEQNEDLFNNNEISYAEISQLEADLKEKEGALKAQEDRDEYKSYVEAVFDPVYDGLQADIKSLMDLYIEGESLLSKSVAGVESLKGRDAPSTQDCLELLTEMHEQIEKRHEKVVLIVAERDKRYKKTEIQPLYAAGNIARMKSVEKHFEGAEKQAILRAKREKGERVGELVNFAEEIVVGAVGVEQGEIDHILEAIKGLEDGKGEEEVLTRAQTVLTLLKSSSKMLLKLFNKLETELNNSILDAEIAEAHAASADAAKIKELENEKLAGAKKMTDEYERRVTVLDQDNDEIAALIAKKGGKAELTEEQEKEKRLKTALEEAKRRNGHI